MSIAVFKDRRITLAAVAVFIVVGIVLWRTLSAAQPKPGPAASAVPVSVTTVERRDVAHRVTGIGNVESLHSVVLRPQVSGIVTDVLFKEGQLVRKGDLLARIDDRAIAAALKQAEAQRARNAAALKSAELDFTRYDNLLKEEAISQQMVEQQRATVDQLRATLLADEAAIATAQVQLSYTRIVSPLDGRAGLRHVDAGNLVQAGDQTGLVTVTQLDPISVVFTLPQDLLPRIQPLLRKGSVEGVGAFERDGGPKLADGRLTMLDNQIDMTSGTIRLRAEFPNKQGTLWPGQFVTVQLQTSVSNDAVVVPARSVQEGLNGSFVFRVRDDKAEVVPVVVGYRENELAVIQEGLAQGDVVVTDGQSRLRSGVAVKTDATAQVAKAEQSR